MVKLSKIHMNTKNQLNSAWTPLGNEQANSQIFNERKLLVLKWFSKWTERQRREVIIELLTSSKVKTSEYVANHLKQKLPIHQQDFTHILPRILSIYVFSFLDPKSLSRAARVCWHWKFLTDSDQIWMPKCIRIGWFLPFQPSPFETGVWKRFYIECLQNLKYPKLPDKEENDNTLTIDNLNLNSSYRSGISISTNVGRVPSDETARSGSRKQSHRSASGKQRHLISSDISQVDTSIPPKSQFSSSWKPAAPWRASDKIPSDIIRFNYLDNDQEFRVFKARARRQKGKSMSSHNSNNDAVRIEHSVSSMTPSLPAEPNESPHINPLTHGNRRGGFRVTANRGIGRPAWATRSAILPPGNVEPGNYFLSKNKENGKLKESLRLQDTIDEFLSAENETADVVKEE